MAGAMSEKVTWLINIHRLLYTGFFDDISSVQLPAAKYSHFFFFLTFYENLTTYFKLLSIRLPINSDHSSFLATILYNIIGVYKPAKITHTEVIHKCS
jgi:hypothetical protein